ncbi:hypothetical protein KP509_21G057800 [Ceratopteris richardii]|uniref:Uncharacterized protein n=1 Tax=Ceratopteris richardii TaxID=49495 RepID=A0A8T2SBR2_CERRI|nr:hypothetical protein KP509_21G057800 [Ceratopteris richardii]
MGTFEHKELGESLLCGALSCYICHPRLHVQCRVGFISLDLVVHMAVGASHLFFAGFFRGAVV